MGYDRRDFFRTAALGAVTLVAGESRAGADTPLEPDQSFGVLVDTVICISCRKCEWACRKTHFDPDALAGPYDDKSVFKQHRRPTRDTYTVLNEFRDPAKPEKAYALKVQCMHCRRPACVSACIVGALQKTPQGPVIYDAWKCIGCRYCMVACPFQIPAYEYNDALAPQVRKCTFCNERTIGEGKRPACVEICPNDALTFGRRPDLLDVAYTRIKTHPDRYFNYVYGESEVGGTCWLYLAPADFANTELPKLPEEPIPHLTESIQHGVFKSFVPPLALYGVLGLVMYALRPDKSESDHKEVTHE